MARWRRFRGKCRRLVGCGWATLGALLLFANCQVRSEEPGAEMSRLKSDERIIFFPTAAKLHPDGRAWSVPIHGWVFEPEADDLMRGFFLRQMRETLQADDAGFQSEILEQRLRWFLVDNERGKRIAVRIGSEVHTLPPSDVDGHFETVLELAEEFVSRFAAGGQLPFAAVLEAGDSRAFRGTVSLVRPSGLSVVSDIDDTIKITEVSDKRKVLENTFVKPFRAVDGMAAAYRRWANAGASIHFVSASPWQLYEPLSTFFGAAGFPPATYHLRRVRLKDSSILSLLADPLKAKLPLVESLFTDYPQRTFILVGDSGERDPEIYGELARRHPDQVSRIFLRDVTGEPRESVRYQRAFQGVPPKKWGLFRGPSGPGNP